MTAAQQKALAIQRKRQQGLGRPIIFGKLLELLHDAPDREQLSTKSQNELASTYAGRVTISVIARHASDVSETA
jgi:hypothetical protein